MCNERLRIVLSHRGCTISIAVMHPSLEHIGSYKLNFGMECYLKHVNNSKFQVALSKLRTSSHSLEFERGRYTCPKLSVDQPLCMSCNVVEDEEHFVLHYQNNREERKLLIQKIIYERLFFFHFFFSSSSEQFVFLMRRSDLQFMAWFGKFLDCKSSDVMRVHVEDKGLFFCGFFVTGGSVWWHAVPSVM